MLSKRSLKNLANVHPLLVILAHELEKRMRIVVIQGHRGKDLQDKYFEEGTSKLKFPKSKHNALPSEAIDVCPRPIDWSHIEGFKQMGAFAKEIAAELGISIRWGGDWDKFKDYVHIELKE